MISIRSKHLNVVYRYVTIAEDSINWSHMKRGWAYIAFVSVLIAAAVLLRYFDPFFVRALRLIAFDGYQRLHPEQYDPNLPVRIVDIDEQSLSKIGQWPWPRTTIANLVEDLASWSSAVVGFDVLFAEPDRASAEEIAKRLPAPQASALLAAAEGKPDDRCLPLHSKQTPSVLSVSLVQGQARRSSQKLALPSGQDPRPFILNFDVVSKNLPSLDAAHGIGAFLTPDRDQIVGALRYLPHGETFGPSLAPKRFGSPKARSYLLKASNASGETCVWKPHRPQSHPIGKIEVPTDSGSVYSNSRTTIPHIHPGLVYLPET
jgi:adenylate cyclase